MVFRSAKTCFFSTTSKILKVKMAESNNAIPDANDTMPVCKSTKLHDMFYVHDMPFI